MQHKRGVLNENTTIIYIDKYSVSINIHSKEISHIDIITRMIPNRPTTYLLKVNTHCEDIDAKFEGDTISLSYVENTIVKTGSRNLYC